LVLAKFRKLIFGISPEEATFARRGFRTGDLHARDQLERIGEIFLYGYHAALEELEIETLQHRLNRVELAWRGFAFEGAAMGLTLLDQLSPWRKNRLPLFLSGPGSAHIYLIHVGVGWALARLPWRIRWPPQGLDPLLYWLAMDGYGFHEGYFYWSRYANKQSRPKHLSGYANRAFDQGLGRSLWFVGGADVAWISDTIAAFPPARQADLWSGVGLACAYAGGVNDAQIRALRAAAGSFHPSLAQGVAFAAKARQRAGNPADHTALACEIVWGLSAAEAAQVTDEALEDLQDQEILGSEPAYERWRQRIQAQVISKEVLS